MSRQQILLASESYAELDDYFRQIGARKVLLVCDSAIRFLRVNDYFNGLPARLGVEVVRFDDFLPNPRYDSVVKGVALFHAEGCDAIAAVGGGSAIDVAKCVKLYSNMDDGELYLKQKIVPNAVPLMAMPTTAGTGSEATRYAVVYYQGEKQSVTDESCIPSTVLFDASALKTLPLYQKKSALLDALCHAVESFWSVNSNAESKGYSRQAIALILENMDGYLAGNDDCAHALLKAANLGGKAINITQTTAGHAMCYKLTSLYGAAHGHAAALCVRRLWPYMLEHLDACVDPRGEAYLAQTMDDLADAMGCAGAKEAAERFNALFDGLELEVPACADAAQLETLTHSVNPVRLKNHPVALDEDAIRSLYTQILK